MKSAVFFLITFFITAVLGAQNIHELESRDFRVPVTILGTFHFAYPNLDRVVTEKDKQIDILSAPRQAELSELMDKLLAFRPTVIAIESMRDEQETIDSLYAEFLAGRYQPEVNEEYQIGFRLARMAGVKKIYCIDAWGDYERYLTRDTFWVHYEKFLNKHPFEERRKAGQRYNDTAAKMNLIDYYRYANSPETLSRLQSAYFLANFYFEEEEGDYAGTDWVTTQWYNRNLRIVRNLMRIPVTPDDRIFILYGNGHHALLRDYLEYAPFFEYVPVIDYLD